MKADSMRALVMPEAILIAIERDVVETIVTTCWKHEFDMYAEIHPEGAVRIIENPIEHGVFIGTADEIKARTRDELLSMDDDEPLPHLCKVFKHPAKPLRVGEELARLRNVFGPHPDIPQIDVVDKVYSDPRLLVMECGGEYKPPVQAAAPAKRNAA